MFVKFLKRGMFFTVALILLFVSCSCTGGAALKLLTLPTKTEYTLGETLDLTGGMVQLALPSGNIELPMTDRKIRYSGYDPTVIGAQTVTIYYEYGGQNLFTSFQVVVEERKSSPIKIRIGTPPDKSEYVEGQPFDSTGLTVLLCYEDGSIVPSLKYTLSVGEMVLLKDNGAVTVKYGKLETTFYIIVKARVKEKLIFVTKPSNTEFVSGDAASIDGATLGYLYNDGNIESVAEDTKFELSPLVLSYATTEITVTDGGLLLVLPVTVSKRTESVENFSKSFADMISNISKNEEQANVYGNAYFEFKILKTEDVKIDDKKHTVGAAKLIDITLSTGLAGGSLPSFVYLPNADVSAVLKVHIYALMAMGKNKITIETDENIIVLTLTDGTVADYQIDGDHAVFETTEIEDSVVHCFEVLASGISVRLVRAEVNDGVSKVDISGKLVHSLWWNSTLAQKKSQK